MLLRLSAVSIECCFAKGTTFSSALSNIAVDVEGFSLLVVIPEAGVPVERFCSMGWEGNLRLFLPLSVLYAICEAPLSIWNEAGLALRDAWRTYQSFLTL